MRKSLRQLLESTGSFHHSIRFTSLYFTLFPFNDIKYDYHIPKDKNGTRTFGKRSIYLSLIPTDSVSRRLRLHLVEIRVSLLRLSSSCMASHTGQKWSTFFYWSRDFLFKLTFLFQVEGFNLNRDLFYLSRDVSIQVEIFFLQVEMFLFKSRFLCRDFYFKSRIFFFMSRFLFQVENFFFMSRFFFQVEVFISCRREFLHVDIFIFKRRIFFLSQAVIFVLFEVFQVDISQFKARCYPGVLVGISWQW